MSDFNTYTDTALYAELAGRESTLGHKGMAARLNDREISNVGVLHTDPRCRHIDEHAATAKRPAEVRVATPDEVARQPGCKVCEARP